ncbi:hypothetical protein HHI36_017168 [Cryptolaemus montrouzieri]|uniref:Integrase zinc-binding domain-containing protein n=1 Tax=Cryptolaemus montrouzieri TaxID=559131 RepID=A0ABD2NMK2_9CUCU
MSTHKRQYDEIGVEGISKLIHLVTEQENLKYYVFDEELYEVLFEAHTLTGHGGRDRMIKQLETKYYDEAYHPVPKLVQALRSKTEPQEKRGGCEAFIIQ